MLQYRRNCSSAVRWVNFMSLTVARAPYTFFLFVFFFFFFFIVVDVLISSATEIFICSMYVDMIKRHRSCWKRQTDERWYKNCVRAAQTRSNHINNIQTWTTNWHTKYFVIPAIRQHIYRSKDYSRFEIFPQKKCGANIITSLSFPVSIILWNSLCIKCTPRECSTIFSFSNSTLFRFSPREVILTAETMCRNCECEHIVFANIFLWLRLHLVLKIGCDFICISHSTERKHMNRHFANFDVRYRLISISSSSNRTQFFCSKFSPIVSFFFCLQETYAKTVPVIKCLDGRRTRTRLHNFWHWN